MTADEAARAAEGLFAQMAAAAAGPLPDCRCGHVEEEHFDGTEAADYYDCACFHGAKFEPDAWDQETQDKAVREAVAINQDDHDAMRKAIAEVMGWPVIQTADGDCSCNIYRPVRP